jgi:hypothetical protein
LRKQGSHISILIVEAACIERRAEIADDVEVRLVCEVGPGVRIVRPQPARTHPPDRRGDTGRDQHGELDDPNSIPAHADQFWSLHPSGAMFPFGDGSVRLVKARRPLRIFHALATRAGGEIVPADAY